MYLYKVANVRPRGGGVISAQSAYIRMRTVTHRATIAVPITMATDNSEAEDGKNGERRRWQLPPSPTMEKKRRMNEQMNENNKNTTVYSSFLVSGNVSLALFCIYLSACLYEEGE